MIGVRADFDGLRLVPCVPKAWTEWSATKYFRGAIYDIIFRKAQGSVGRHVKQLSVDGKEISGNLVPVFTSGRHRVEVMME